MPPLGFEFLYFCWFFWKEVTCRLTRESYASLIGQSEVGMLSKTKSLTERGPLLPKTSLHPVVAAESYLKMELLLLLLLERCFLLRFLGRYTHA